MGEKGGAAEVAIIGAGVIGLASAVFLRRAGLGVSVFDPMPPAGGTSFGNAGLLSVDSCVPISLPGMLREVPRWLSDPLGPLAVDPRYFPKALPWLMRWIRAGRMERVLAASDALRALHKPGLEQYRELLGTRFHDLVRQAGQIQLWDSDEESVEERVSRELRARHGIETQPLDRDELRQLVPEIGSGVRRALFFPANGHTVNPQRLVQSLGEMLQEAGGTLRRERVMKILPEGGNGAGPLYRLITNVGNHRFAKIVVAGGAWSKALLSPLGIGLPLESERGYHVTVRDPGFALRIPIIYKNRAFAVTPMEMGLRLAGTVEIAGLDLPLNERRATAILHHAKTLFPSLRSEDISIWMGHRPSLPDSVRPRPYRDDRGRRDRPAGLAARRGPSTVHRPGALPARALRLGPVSTRSGASGAVRATYIIPKRPGIGARSSSAVFFCSSLSAA